jgi:hypothetical protein|tara:strand:- start:1137 stop:1436 length:300 start_codon:yes stop_codon:yes gene_type:complete
MSVRVIVKNTDKGYKLYVASPCGENPAGDRLARGKPLPNDRWEYESEEEAKNAASGLQIYIDQYERKREKGIRKNKKLEEQENKLREHVARYYAFNRKT